MIDGFAINGQIIDWEKHGHYLFADGFTSTLIPWPSFLRVRINIGSRSCDHTGQPVVKAKASNRTVAVKGKRTC